MRSSRRSWGRYPLFCSMFVFWVSTLHASELRGLPDRMVHFGNVSGIAYSPDGKSLATSSWDGLVRVWALDSFGSKSRELKGHRGMVLCVAFSPDGKRIASGGEDETIRLWNVDDGTEVARLDGGRGKVYGLAFSPDGKTLASAEFNFTARLWDIERKESTVRFNGHNDRVNAVAFAPDGKTVVTGCYDKKVRRFSVKGDELWSASTGDDVYSVAISPDGKMVAAASRANLIHVWDAKGKTLGTIPIQDRDWGHAVAFGRDGTLVFGTWGGVAQMWDVEFLAMRHSVLAKTTRDFAQETIWAVAVSPNGKQVAVGIGRRVERFEIEGGTQRAVLARAGETLAVAPEGRLATAGGETILLSSVRPGGEQVEFKGHTGSIRSLALSKDGSVLVSGGFDKTVRVWNTATGKERIVLKDYPSEVWSVAISAEGSRVAAGGWAQGKPGSVIVWEVATGKVLKTFTLTAEHVWSVALSPDGTLLAAAAGRPGERGEFKVWEIDSGKETATRKRDKSPFTAVAFAPAGTSIALGSHDSIELLDPRTGSSRMLPQDKDEVNRLPGIDFIVFSPDGKTLLTGGKNYDKSMVRLWDLDSGRFRSDVVSAWASLEIASAAFSPDGKFVYTGASGGHRNEVRVWDISSEVIRFRLKLGAAAMSMDASGKLLLVGGTSSNRPDGVRLVYLTAPGETIVITPGESEVSHPVALTPDGKLVAYSHTNYRKKDQPTSIILWDVATKAEKSRLEGHKGGVLRLVANATGTCLASIGYDGEVILWELPSGKLLRRIAAHKGMASALAFSVDGQLLVSGGEDRKVRVWDVATGEAKNGFDTESSVESTAFSPDSKTVAASCSNGMALLWPVAGGEPIRIRVHSCDAETLAFSPDGRLLVVGTAEAMRPGLLRIFNAADGKPLTELPGYSSGITTVLFSADGKTLACGGYGSEITFSDASRLVSMIVQETGVTVPTTNPDSKTETLAAKANTPAANPTANVDEPAVPALVWVGIAVAVAIVLGFTLLRRGKRT